MGLILSGVLGRVLALAKLVPWWAWVLALVLAWGGWQKHKAASTAREFAKEQAAAAADREKALQASVAESTRRLQAQNRIAQDAQAKTAKARADATAAADDLKRLRDRLAKPTNSGPGNPASAAGSQTNIIAESLAECAGRYTALAGIADAAIIAGQACEQSYGALVK